jgi:hypothetical protein
MNSPVREIFHEPSFWVTTGVFFSQSVVSPLALLRHIFLTNIELDASLLISTFGRFLYAAMHLFFIKAYLCSCSRQAT